MMEIRGGLILVRENAAGTVNGINLSFTTGHKYVAGTLRVELNGISLVKNDDFTETGAQNFDFIEAPSADLGYTDKVVVEYQPR